MPSDRLARSEQMGVSARTIKSISHRDLAMAELFHPARGSGASADLAEYRRSGSGTAPTQAKAAASNDLHHLQA